jgi:HAMP domain-containing protein
MIIELIILAGLFLIFIGVVMLAIINWLEARELKRQSERLSRYKKEYNNGR